MASPGRLGTWWRIRTRISRFNCFAGRKADGSAFARKPNGGRQGGLGAGSGVLLDIHGEIGRGLDVGDSGAVSGQIEARNRRGAGTGVKLAAQRRDFRLYPLHGGELDEG
jgi:hypothetical protein